MEINPFAKSHTDDVVSLFTRVFSDSEGEQEGAVIGSLVSALINTTEESDLCGCLAVSDGQIVGAVLFSRLTLSNNESAFILSPLAVDTAKQKSGVGMALIKSGIELLKAQNVDFLFTYGDPAYYGKAGFKQIAESSVKAPLNLTYPEGWLAQSLLGKSTDMAGVEAQCVAALDDQQYW